MTTAETALAAVHGLQRQLDDAFGASSPTSHHAHPLNSHTLPVFLSNVCSSLTSSVAQLETALNTTSATPALSKTLATLNDFANERYIANHQVRVQEQQQEQQQHRRQARYTIPKHNIQTALQLMATSCGFELFSEDNMVTLGGKVSVIDFELDAAKRNAVQVHFTHGSESQKDEQLDRMLLVLAQADVLNPLWDALADIKRLDAQAVSQPDIFQKTKELVASTSPSLAYQVSPEPTFVLHAPPEQTLGVNLDAPDHAPGSLAMHLIDSQMAKLHFNTQKDAPPLTLSISPSLVFGRSTGSRLMQALGKLDFPLPSSVQQGQPVFLENLLTSSTNKVLRFDAQDRFSHTLPDVAPLVFSLSTPGVERGFILTSLPLDGPEQLQSVLPILRQQARLNALFRSAFDPTRKVSRHTVSEEDQLFQPTQDEQDAEKVRELAKLDLNSAPLETSIEVHWGPQGVSVLFPLETSGTLDLHVLEIDLVSEVATLDGQVHEKVQQVLQTGCSLPLAVRWLQRNVK